MVLQCKLVKYLFRRIGLELMISSVTTFYHNATAQNRHLLIVFMIICSLGEYLKIRNIYRQNGDRLIYKVSH